MFNFIDDNLDFSKLNKLNLKERNRNSQYISEFKLDNLEGDNDN